MLKWLHQLLKCDRRCLWIVPREFQLLLIKFVHNSTILLSIVECLRHVIFVSCILFLNNLNNFIANICHQAIVTSFHFILCYILNMMYDFEVHKKSNCSQCELIEGKTIPSNLKYCSGLIGWLQKNMMYFLPIQRKTTCSLTFSFPASFLHSNLLWTFEIIHSSKNRAFIRERARGQQRGCCVEDRKT